MDKTPNNEVISTPPPISSFNESSWHLETLFQKAFARTKERFLSYLLTVLISFGIGMLVGLITLIIIGLLFLLYFITKSGLIVGVFGFLAAIGIIIGFIYVSAWTQLAITTILISPEKIRAGEAFNKVKPLIWGFVKFNLLMSLFLLGLLPFGLLSLGVVLILWSIWATFTTYIYLEYQKNGLLNLWTGKAMISQKFWGVAGRISLVQIISFIISYSLSAAAKQNSFFGPIYLAYAILVGPFTISYLYEIYKCLEVPKTAPAPKVWIVLSIVGWILLIVLPFFLIDTIAAAWPQIMKSLPGTFPGNMNNFPIPTGNFKFPTISPPSSI